MRKLNLILLILFTLNCNSQNLVPNSSFEIYDSCPHTQSQFTLTPPWNNVIGNTGDPDYYNSCAAISTGFSVPTNTVGYQQAMSGSGYYGLFAYNSATELREYLTSPLLSSMKPNAAYYVGLYICFSGFGQFAIDKFGIYLSNSEIIATTNAAPLSYISCFPQVENKSGILKDTMNWVLIADTIIANGGEKHITIGNFETDNNTNALKLNNNIYNPRAYYLVDSVFIYPLNKQTIQIDTTICLGDSIILSKCDVMRR